MVPLIKCKAFTWKLMRGGESAHARES